MPLAVGTLLFAPIFAQKAYAQYPCPYAGPGEIVVGSTEAGYGIASVLLCAPDPNAQQSYQEDSSYSDYGSSDSSSYYDPELAALEFEAANAMLRAQQQLELLQDPDYLRYLSGSWRLFPTTTSEAIAPGEYCAASFFKASMDPAANHAPIMITLSGAGGDYNGAMLTIASEAIPKPDAMEIITVTLTQNDDPPATVRAFNYTMPDLPYGVIAFAVPTMDALLDGMEDVQSFDVAIEGQSVANTTWHSGLTVRQELRNCLNGQPYSVTDIDIVPDRLQTP
ncbi:MAG TPA: hypothetical protein V6C88_17765 [Chroococcidiopsis sp.]